jgi:hypothetical protein
VLIDLPEPAPWALENVWGHSPEGAEPPLPACWYDQTYLKPVMSEPPEEAPSELNPPGGWDQALFPSLWVRCQPLDSPAPLSLLEALADPAATPGANQDLNDPIPALTPLPAQEGVTIQDEELLLAPLNLNLPDFKIWRPVRLATGLKTSDQR